MLAKLGAWLVLAALTQPVPGREPAFDGAAAPRAPEPRAAMPVPPGSVAGRVFDRYLDVRIALARHDPILADQVARLDDLAPLQGELTAWLDAHGIDFDAFSRAHRLVARDPGLRSRVEAILAEHAPRSGGTSGPEKAPPEGGAIIPPQEPSP